ncbi:MAG: hypothetical protein L0312_32385 [Acidobacteria bacterium]|nr:hypothetical protein [Acidobacteriota bacterium]MCI0723651.1 hypothetical protein [Acidobacteriota bacterium]
MSNFFSTQRMLKLPLCLMGMMLAMSCGSGKTQVSKNSPEYIYSQAKEAMAEVKYEKAISLTNDILQKFPDSDYAAKARILRVVLLAGLSSAYRDMAEAYLAGFEKSIQNAGKLRSVAFDYYRKQKNAALGFSEACDYFLKDGSARKTYVLECDFPTREVAHNKRLDEVREGGVLDGEQRRAAEEHEVWDGMLNTLSFFVGAAGDRPKAKKLLESGSKTMDRPEFIVRLGRTLLDNQKVFGRQALNDVQQYRQLYERALQCSELSQKLLKESPSPETQAMADNLKTELESLEKKGKKS